MSTPGGRATDAASRWVFVLLAPGPALGVLAMLRLRALPDAAKIAQGRR